jgi:hypothetical protein
METEILKHIQSLQDSARLADKDDLNDGYLKALLNVKQYIKERIEIRDKTGYYKDFDEYEAKRMLEKNIRQSP